MLCKENVISNFKKLQSLVWLVLYFITPLIQTSVNMCINNIFLEGLHKHARDRHLILKYWSDSQMEHIILKWSSATHYSESNDHKVKNYKDILMLGTGKLLGYVHQHGWAYWQRFAQKKSINVKAAGWTRMKKFSIRRLLVFVIIGLAKTISMTPGTFQMFPWITILTITSHAF